MRLRLALLFAAALKRARRDESGQAVVESAIVIPLMTFLILGVIQLVMMQHARIMTEYAAFNAARAGIVWNADRIIMENAAIISLMPTYEGLMDQADIGNPGQMLKRILQRALLYQVNRRLPQAIDLMKNGAGKLISQIPIGGTVGGKVKDLLNDGKDKVLDIAEKAADFALQQAITGALGADDDRLVTVTILNPSAGIAGPLGLGNLQGILGGTFGQRGREIDFDDFSQRAANRLTIRVRYLYMMRVPFANWVIHQAWLAGRAGKQLYGAIWNPQQFAPGETGFRTVSPVTANSPFDPLLRKLDALGQQGIYMVPMTASYTMRMQSNPYKQSLQVR
ncbi:MAG: pilus assembly protein [Myxococcales bacterium]|nr:pilus assembly protein [Myxococcales bacterium]